MSTINPHNPASNPQLAGILGSVPMPAAVLSPNASVAVGADAGGFSIPSSPQPGTGASSASGGGGTVLVGGGGTTPAAGTPGVGAQPAPPPGVVAAGQPGAGTTTTTPVTTTPAATTTPTTQATPENGSPLAEAISGFGKANRDEPIKASIDGATFGFPSFRATSKQLEAPAIEWGPGWKKVQKDGMWYMEHPNGSKAIPAVEYRITPRPADKVQAIKVANGWGKKFPDGSLLIFDRKEGPYRLDPKGNKHKVGLGTITIGGVKVRVFEASVVRTLDPNGKVDVFDSRGNVSKGSTRWNMAASLGAANAGAAMGGGKADGSGPTKGGGAPGKLVGGGAITTVQLTQDVERLTGIAREIIGEIRSGNVDPARLEALQAQLSQLPSGILQAAGAAGTMTSDGRTVAQPSTEVGGVTGGAAPPAAGTASGGGTTPTPGVDANAASKELAAGAAAKIAASLLSSDLHGKQARFGQLPEDVQQAIATAFGSDRGVAAFKADQLFSFAADGTVRLAEAGTVYLRHQPQVRGAGPGEDRALTMRPNRQPGDAGRVAGGGATASGGAATTTPTVAGGGSGSSSASGHAGHAGGQANAPAAAGGGTTVGAASNGSGPSNIELFPAGGETRHVDLGGVNGTFTWRTLPARARAAILEILRSGDEAASTAFASRTGSGWSIDPNALIVVDAGFASFPDGLSMRRGATTSGGGGGATPAVGVPTPAGGASGPSSQSHAHDATRPPTAGSASGGGATGGTVRPGMQPPVPAVDDPGEGATPGHAHAGGGAHEH